MSFLLKEIVLERSLATHSAILDELLGRSSGIEQRKRRKRIEDKQPRRGDGGVGVSKWHIVMDGSEWRELRRPERYDESSWDGKRFQSIYGVPAVIFDQLVKEASEHDVLRGKQFHGDGRKGPFSKPIELKVAAVLEICQAGLIFKTSERLYNISQQVIEQFFHEFTRLQVVHEFHKHVYLPSSREDIDRILDIHSKMGYPGAITMCDGVKVEWLGCPFAEEFAHT